MKTIDTAAARQAVLGRIRESLRDVPRDETAAEVPVARDYETIDPMPRGELLDRFVERVSEYKAVVHRVAAGGIADAVAAALDRRGARSLVVATDLPADWLPAGRTFVVDRGLTNAELDASEGVLTASALGIAQTGTIVLDGGPGQGRRAISLVPDYHLCVIFESQVVGSVPEGVEKLREVMSAPGRPVTFISGPSATSDIELNRVEGVHGPRTLEVLVVAG